MCITATLLPQINYISTMKKQQTGVKCIHVFTHELKLKCNKCSIKLEDMSKNHSPIHIRTSSVKHEKEAKCHCKS